MPKLNITLYKLSVCDVVDFASLSTGASNLGGNEKTIPRKRPVSDWAKNVANVLHTPDIMDVNVPREKIYSSDGPHRERSNKRPCGLLGAYQ